MRLPLRLGIEPLADSVCEVRFKTQVAASTLLPGMLFSVLDGPKSIDRLPTAEIPAPIRHGNPDLKYAPTIRINWKQFLIAISDYSLAVSCRMPYPGWGLFKPAIMEVMGVFAAAQFAQSVERCSFKSTDVIEKKHGGPKDVMHLALTVGNNDLTDKLFHIRGEVKDGPVYHIIQVASESSVTLIDGSVKDGMFIDTDTVLELHDLGLKDFSSSISDHIELVHAKNKEMFFHYLKEDFLQKLEPVYA